MRRSPLRHPLAVLRTIIGIGQKELGALIDRSPRTVQAIEIGKLRLTPELGIKICEETGVSFAWLMLGDPRVVPTNRSLCKYEREDYVHAQSAKITSNWPEKKLTEWSDALGFALNQMGPLIQILATAAKSGQMRVACFELGELAKTMERKFGRDDDDLAKYLRRCKFSVSYPDGREECLFSWIPTYAKSEEEDHKAHIENMVRVKSGTAPIRPIRSMEVPPPPSPSPRVRRSHKADEPPQNRDR